MKSVANMLFESLITEKLDINGIMRNKSIRNIFLDRYNTYVFLKKLNPVESLDKDGKWHYWNQTEGIDDRMNAVRILYILDYMATNYESTNSL